MTSHKDAVPTPGTNWLPFMTVSRPKNAPPMTPMMMVTTIPMGTAAQMFLAQRNRVMTMQTMAMLIPGV